MQRFLVGFVCTFCVLFAAQEPHVPAAAPRIENAEEFIVLYDELEGLRNPEKRREDRPEYLTEERLVSLQKEHTITRVDFVARGNNRFQIVLFVKKVPSKQVEYVFVEEYFGHNKVQAINNRLSAIQKAGGRITRTFTAHAGPNNTGLAVFYTKG